MHEPMDAIFAQQSCRDFIEGKENRKIGPDLGDGAHVEEEGRIVSVKPYRPIMKRIIEIFLWVTVRHFGYIEGDAFQDIVDPRRLFLGHLVDGQFSQIGRSDEYGFGFPRS